MELAKRANRSWSGFTLREVELAVKKNTVVAQFTTDDKESAADLAYFLSAIHWLNAFTLPTEVRIRELRWCLKGICA